ARAVAGDENVAVQISGQGTSWLTDAPVLDLGADVTITTIVNNNTSLTATFTLASTASTGPRTLKVISDGAALTAPFSIAAAAAAGLSSFTPNSGNFGQTVTVTIIEIGRAHV